MSLELAAPIFATGIFLAGISQGWASGTAFAMQRNSSTPVHSVKLAMSADAYSGSLLTPFHSAPSYARWGRLAVERTREKYGTGITDYSYEGRTALGGSLAEERFKLALQHRPGSPAAVIVRITVEGDRLIRVEWEETSL